MQLSLAEEIKAKAIKEDNRKRQGSVLCLAPKEALDRSKRP